MEDTRTEIPLLDDRHAIAAVRVAAAAMMFIHGCYRVYDGRASGLRRLPRVKGLPFGVAIAWTLTILEIVLGALLMAGRFVSPICAWFAFQLVMGILLVHGKEGWFVVGGGAHGMEYSVLLISSFVIVGANASRKRGAVSEPG
jgi:putative oxidoreductase